MINTLKEKLNAARKSGKTLTEIGEETDIDPSRLSRFARGERLLDAKACETLLIYFKVMKAKKK